MDELTARLEAAFKAWAALDGEDRAALVASADAPRCAPRPTHALGDGGR